MKLREFAVEDLPPRVRAVLQLWLDGHDVRTLGFSRPTLYRYRRRILDASGLDVFLAAPVKGESRALLDAAEIRSREVHEMPPRVQRSLFGAGL